MHEAIKQTLERFHVENGVPNMLFFGPMGSGKTALVDWFIHLLYDGNREKILQYTLRVNCAFGKGIKFIRENLKNFAKINVGDASFKVIVLQNADKLTGDAQSALRRCIEEFSFNTRFFMVATNKYKLLKPILSRLCEVYVPPAPESLHQAALARTFPATAGERARVVRFRQTVRALAPDSDLMGAAEALVAQAYSAADLAQYVENEADLETTFKYAWLMQYVKVRGDFRSEELLLYLLLFWLLHPKDFRPECGVLSPL